MRALLSVSTFLMSTVGRDGKLGKKSLDERARLRSEEWGSLENFSLDTLALRSRRKVETMRIPLLSACLDLSLPLSCVQLQAAVTTAGVTG